MKKTKIAGIDEAGRGPLAGPLFVACVSLHNPIEGLKDSKKLSAKKRLHLFAKILQKAEWVSFAAVGEQIIDRDNILNATLLGMECCIQSMGIRQQGSGGGCNPDGYCGTMIYVDGNVVPKRYQRCCRAVVKGDQKNRQIQAASVVAKVLRDQLMTDYQMLYKRWSFDRHWGYPTPEHIKEIQGYGISKIHRRSFAPVQQAKKK